MENVCPDCHARESYTLADGRRQCKICRRKFTPGGRKRKLPESVHGQVREAFWKMQPAETVAVALNLNRKTVQKMYVEFREMMAACNRRQRDDVMSRGNVLSRGEGASAGYRSGEYPMFYLVDLGDTVGLFMADEFPSLVADLDREKQEVLMVYRRDPGELSLEPDAVFRRLLWNTEGGGRCQDCFTAMLEMMKPYRGIPADKTRLYVEEMLFRYNCRDREIAMRCLDPAVASQSGETVAN